MVTKECQRTRTSSVKIEFAQVTAQMGGDINEAQRQIIAASAAANDFKMWLSALIAQQGLEQSEELRVAYEAIQQQKQQQRQMKQELDQQFAIDLADSRGKRRALRQQRKIIEKRGEVIATLMSKLQMQTTMRTILAHWHRARHVVMSGVTMSGEKYTVHRVNDVSASKSKEVLHQDQKVDERTTPIDDNTHKDMLMIAKMLHDDDTPKAGSSDDTWQVVERKNRRKRFLAKYNPPIQPLAPGRVRVCEICMMKGIPFRCRCHDEESTHEGDSTDPAGGSATDRASSHKVPADYEKMDVGLGRERMFHR